MFLSCNYLSVFYAEIAFRHEYAVSLTYKCTCKVSQKVDFCSLACFSLVKTFIVKNMLLLFLDCMH